MQPLAEITTDTAILRKQSRRVDRRHNIEPVISKMRHLMQQHFGDMEPVGLSAIQVGVDLQIITLASEGDHGPPLFILNPSLTKTRGTQMGDEMCLSVPGRQVRIRRPYQVTVAGMNDLRRPVRYRFKGFQARVCCHELDHLKGVLITDHETGEQ